MERFNCEIEKGLITVFFGNSGCGKTTLTRLLLDLEKADSGEVVVPDVRKSVVFQEDRLLEWLTVGDNIASVLEKGDDLKIIEDVLKLMEIYDYKDKYPNELSGGMKRRLAFARALCYKGEMYILDEPFKGFDDELKKRILPVIFKLKEHGKTIILITHNKEEADLLADKIYFMKGPLLKITNPY